MTTANERPAPPALFEKPRTSQQPLKAQLGDFAPKTDEDFPPIKVPERSLAPDNGTGRHRRRGKAEARTKQAPVRLTPTEFEELNALCDRLDMSYPDAIMFLVRKYADSDS
ncbi:MAG: hypothetical protein KGP14_00435 [Betaproteobacteria bacterium]|nr:hypothetical protein [Betaproteobacteria bacterium]